MANPAVLLQAAALGHEEIVENLLASMASRGAVSYSESVVKGLGQSV